MLPLSRLHDVRGVRKALMAARPFVPGAGNIYKAYGFIPSSVEFIPSHRGML